MATQSIPVLDLPEGEPLFPGSLATMIPTHLNCTSCGENKVPTNDCSDREFAVGEIFPVDCLGCESPHLIRVS